MVDKERGKGKPDGSRRAQPKKKKKWGKSDPH